MRRSPTSIEATTLREILADLRKAKKIHQADLAKLLNRHQSYVSKYENGEKILDFIEVLTICEALNINPNVLISEYLEKVLIKKSLNINLQTQN